MSNENKSSNSVFGLVFPALGFTEEVTSLPFLLSDDTSERVEQMQTLLGGLVDVIRLDGVDVWVNDEFLMREDFDVNVHVSTWRYKNYRTQGMSHDDAVLQSFTRGNVLVLSSNDEGEAIDVDLSKVEPLFEEDLPQDMIDKLTEGLKENAYTNADEVLKVIERCSQS